MSDASVFSGGPMNHLVNRLTDHLAECRRILIWGGMGTGKSTLALTLSRRLSGPAGCCQIFELDPGRPPFGVPGAVSRGWWIGDRLEWTDPQALCSLNAARFRLPLIQAAQRLMGIVERLHNGPVIVDPPGVVRGVGGAELLVALIGSLAIDAVVVFHPDNTPPPLEAELSSLGVDLIGIPASPQAARPSSRERAEQRTTLWDAYLANPREHTFKLDRLQLLGTPPPRQVPEAWPGRQAALIDGSGGTIRMGEVLLLAGDELSLRLPAGPAAAPAGILIRDARRNSAGCLETAAPPYRFPSGRCVPAEMTPPGTTPWSGLAPVSAKVGPAWATLAGGVFGDPLLHVRLQQQKQSYFFDLGDPARLMAKVAHQVRAVFITHTHIDHIGGFLWFLRSRIGDFGPCMIFGPERTIERIESHINAVTWDRIEDNAPVFEIFEIHGAILKGARLQPGRKTVGLPDQAFQTGVILAGEHFRVRAVVCDHGIPSVAYAMDFPREFSVRKKTLADSGWPPGPWLGRLKKSLSAGQTADDIRLPDSTIKPAGDLAEKLIVARPGKTLVYAADMADTPQNREKLADLALGAHTLFCEAAFTAADRSRAEANQHLTTTAAAAIARKAGVEQTVPFHFSKRYEHDPDAVYRDIRAAAGPVKILGHYPQKKMER